MFAKMPEGFNNPNSPDFPGMNSTGGINSYPQYNQTEDINETSNYPTNNTQFLHSTNNTNTQEYPDPNLINKATTENTNSSWLDRIVCNMTFLQSYFNIETDDIIKRVITSLIPCNKNFINLVEKNPDLYGPFWIYTTLIFLVASAGSLTKYIQGAQEDDYFQKFIPLAMAVIYGIGFCLPLIVKALMQVFGSETSFVLVLCIYAYSFTVYAPIFILCIPFEQLQWILLFYGVLSSTCFLLLNFWKELNKYVDNRKYFILAVIGIFQISLLFVCKFQFFAHIKETINN